MHVNAAQRIVGTTVVSNNNALKEVHMHLKGFPGIALIILSLVLSACHDPYYDPHYYSNYVAPGEFQYIDYSFDPYETYRIELTTYSGDADIAVYNEIGELVVFSDEYSTRTDEVIFTAGNSTYQVEIYGNLGSDYDLYIEQLPYYDTGLTTDTDGIEFNIDSNVFTGDIYSILATRSFQVNNAYELLTITPSPDPIWLDVTPTGTIYSSPDSNSTTVAVNILETDSPFYTN
ncbi:MAG: hypothetical protein PVJ39_18135, partial [Gammaproteobacteria bacterium]